MLLKYILNVRPVPTTLLSSRNAKKKSFKELALKGDRDNYKEVGVVCPPRDQRGGKGRPPRGMMSPKLGPMGSRTISQAKK